MTIDLTCHIKDGWEPDIRPALPSRDWMDASPYKFAHRCLPLTIANCHGWEILNPCNFRARWMGGLSSDSVEVDVYDHHNSPSRAVSLFGQGTITFHIQGLFRTPPGWNLWVGGSPNYFKDGIQALTGIVETDWAPFTFTMNWKLTRPDYWVEWKRGEPMCFIFPIARHALQQVLPTIEPMAKDEELNTQHTLWDQSRRDFHKHVALNPPQTIGEQWQKHYMRGEDMRGNIQPDHLTKLRLPEFIQKA
jgi:Family of unknown function (DUF6065)